MNTIPHGAIRGYRDGWLFGAAFLVVLGLSRFVQAGTISGATAPGFAESLQSPIAGAPFNGVGFFTTAGGGLFTGVLISPRHVLTAAHAFFPGSDGMGQQIPFASLSKFTLPEFANQTFTPLRVDIAPGFIGMNGMGQGHRVVGKDLAIITLAEPIANAVFYPVNRGQIADERNPMLTTVKVGYGRSGNGQGASGQSGAKRYLLNQVDQFGPVALPADAVGNRRNNPPANTLVYDFDDPAAGGNGSTGLRNAINAALSGAVPNTMLPGNMVVNFEGSPAAGDSGCPMFQRKDANSPWVLVGITSSGSDGPTAFSGGSRYGSVAYDTRINVPEYLQFIDRAIAPEPATIVIFLGVGGCLAFGSSRQRTKPA